MHFSHSADALTTNTKQNLNFEQQTVFWKATNTDGSDYQFKTEFPVSAKTDIEGFDESDIKVEPLVFVAVDVESDPEVAEEGIM